MQGEGGIEKMPGNQMEKPLEKALGNALQEAFQDA
jgi:hypothetical protein